MIPLDNVDVKEKSLTDEFQDGESTPSVGLKADEGHCSDITCIDMKEKQDDLTPVSQNPESFDQKLQETIAQMESALSQGGSPNFKLFWNLRKTCLEMFKGNIAPALRSEFWSRYRELSKEAKKLKDLFDEQSAFAVEQIEIAIKALETEIEEMSEHLLKMHEVDLSMLPKSFLKKKEFYSQSQKKLNLLNAHASRVNNLRKELIKTEMRIKFKNNFFERLSKAGDRIFPERKELIREVSENFEKDIDLFVTNYFGSEKEFVPTYFLRDDIKHLQNIAKVLTLNSQAFSLSRKKLSECWDALKQIDKDRKKEIQTKRDSEKKVFDETLAKIETTALSFKENQISAPDCLNLIDQIFKELRSLELGKEESKHIKEKLQHLKKEAQDRIQEKQDERAKLEREKRYKKQEALLELHARVHEAMQSSKTVEELKAFSDQIHEEWREFSDQSKESLDLGKKLKSLADFILDKEDEEILQSSDSGADSLKALREMLVQKKKRRSEIKLEIEKLRKTAGSYGFDIDKALKQNEQLTLEKERLEKVDMAISEIEDKILETKAKLKQKT